MEPYRIEKKKQNEHMFPVFFIDLQHTPVVKKHLLYCIVLLILFFASSLQANQKSLPFLFLLLGQPDFTLSKTIGAPGEIISIKDSTFVGGDEIEVTFSDGAGFTVRLKAFSVTDGSAKVVVPPYLNNLTDRYEAATTTLSYYSHSVLRKRQFQIDSLPQLTTIATGSVVAVYLQSIVDNLTLALPELDQLGVTYGHDVSDLKLQIQALIDDANSMLAGFNSSGTFNTSSVVSGISPLDDNDLAIVDQLLYAMLVGAYEDKLRSMPLAAKGISTGKSATVSLQTLADDFATASQNSKTGISTLIAQLKSSVDTFGDPTVAPTWGKLLDVAEAAGRIVAVGGMNEIVNFLRSVDSGEAYVPGKGVIDEFSSVLNDFIEANTPSWAPQLVALVDELQNYRKARVKLLCDQKPLPGDLVDVCLEWNVFPTVYSSIERAYFSQGGWAAKSPILFGVNETFYYRIGGNVGLKHAKVNTVTIDWDDGTSDTIVHNSGYPNETGFGGKYIGHQDILPPDTVSHEYTVLVTVVGDNDPAEAHKHEYRSTILVTTDTDPLQVAFTQGDDLLGVNMKGTWVVEITGGAPPFEMTLQRDTWNIDSPAIVKTNRTLRQNTLQHAYPEAGWYTISFLVKDAKGDEVTADFNVLVGDGPDSDYLILDRVEFYAYDDQCDSTQACRTIVDTAWWYDKYNLYHIKIGEAQFVADYTFSGVQEVDYKVDFTFDTPPAIIKKGTALPPIFMSGVGQGKTLGWYLSRQIDYYTKTSPSSSNSYIDGSLIISNREMPYNETTGFFEGTISKSSSSIITVPANAGDGFCIGVKHGWDPGFYATWIYKSYVSQ